MKIKNIFDKNLQEKKEGLNKLLEIMLFSAKNIFSEDFLIFSPQHFLHIKLFCKVTSGMERAPGKKNCLPQSFSAEIIVRVVIIFVVLVRQGVPRIFLVTEFH